MLNSDRSKIETEGIDTHREKSTNPPRSSCAKKKYMKENSHQIFVFNPEVVAKKKKNWEKRKDSRSIV